MGTPSIRIEVSTNLAALQSNMNAAGAAVQNGANTMVAAGKQAEAAFQRLSRATIEANTAQQVVKNTLKAISTGEIPLTARAADDLALAQMEAAQAAREHAAAQAQLKAAMGETNSQMATGFSQATLFSNVLGLAWGAAWSKS
jgi:predicted amidohydrolase